ncbi:MAG: FAD-dependent oxidoreductase, partial [Gordonibacter urolithinfaciens]
MSEESKGISRRSLLKGAALSAASVAALGMIGCAPKEAGSADDAKAGAAGGADGKHTWEVKPEPIPADKVKETVDTEVLVIGGGYSGTCCALAAAEGGAKVTLVEKDAMLNGHGVGGTGAIASRELDKLGISFDKAVEMERWVSTCGNRCRESLVAKWFRESERCMNWFLDLAEKNGAKCMVTVGSRSAVHPEIDCYHMIFGGEIFEQHTMADFVEYLFESEAKQHGAEFVYEMPAVQLVQDDAGKVTGAICQNKDGDYVQYNAPKGVVLATGDVSYNDEYLDEFAPIAKKV